MENSYFNQTSGSSVIFPDSNYNQRNFQLEDIEYEQSFVAYLDVLGFENLVTNGKTKIIWNYFKSIEEILAKIQTRLEKKRVKSIIISDSIILSLETKDDGNKNNEFRQFCIAVRDIQYNLARKNLWLRGGDFVRKSLHE